MGRASTCRSAQRCIRVSRSAGWPRSVDGQVLREDGSVIPGLYAAGACASKTSRRTARATRAAHSWVRARSSGAAPERTPRSSGLRRRRRAGRSRSARVSISAFAEEPSAFWWCCSTAGPVADAHHDAVRALSRKAVDTESFPVPGRAPTWPRRERPLWAWSTVSARTRRAAARPGTAPWPSPATSSRRPTRCGSATLTSTSWICSSGMSPSPDGYETTAAQITQRHVRKLRQEHRLVLAPRAMQRAGREGPELGEAAQQRGLASFPSDLLSPGGHRRTGAGPAVQSTAGRPESNLDVVELNDVVLRVFDCDRGQFTGTVIGFDQAVEADDRRAEHGESVIGVPEERQRIADVPERGRGLGDVAETDFSREHAWALDNPRQRDDRLCHRVVPAPKADSCAGHSGGSCR